MNPEPGQKLYVCPFCGTPYRHDEAYIHGTYGECQKRERTLKPKSA